MIKVIKHGQTEFNATCGRCGCEFTYEYEDIQSEAVRSLTNYSSTRYVKCPDCGNLIYLPPYSNFPTIGEPIPTVPFNTPLGTKDCQDCDWWKKITQPGGFTYVGDTPCTWCHKNPYTVTCDSISTSSTSSAILKGSTQGILNDYVKIKCDTNNNNNKELEANG